eukprot:sb/3470673/
MLAGILAVYLKVHFSDWNESLMNLKTGMLFQTETSHHCVSCGGPIKLKMVAFERKSIAKQICEILGEKNELSSRGLKLWIPRMSTHANIVPKYQSDRCYDLGDMRLGVPHVFFGPGGTCGKITYRTATTRRFYSSTATIVIVRDQGIYILYDILLHKQYIMREYTELYGGAIPQLSDVVHFEKYAGQIIMELVLNGLWSM